MIVTRAATGTSRAVLHRAFEFGVNAAAVQADASRPDDIDRLIDAAIDAYGRLDIVVNNAGVFDFKPLEGITPGHFHKHFDLNVLGALLAIQRALLHLEAAGGGSVINVSSTTSLSPSSGGTVYSAIEAALDAITRSLARELGGRAIRVNTLSPGTVETGGFQNTVFAAPEVRQQIVLATPLGRMGRPDDIGPVAVFLASDEARRISGKAVAVDGGQN